MLWLPDLQPGVLDHVDNLGWTALIESIVLGDGGKNHNRSGSSPLMLARSRGYGDMVKILDAAGAN